MAELSPARAFLAARARAAARQPATQQDSVMGWIAAGAVLLTAVGAALGWC